MLFNCSTYRQRYFYNLRERMKILDRGSYDIAYWPRSNRAGVFSPSFVDLISHTIFICKNFTEDPDFMQFFETHEMWEDYIYNKVGFNLSKKSDEDSSKPLHRRKRFAHKFAVYKEFQHAAKKGKLDAYMDWWRDFYSKNIDTIMEAERSDYTIKLLQKYSLIREEVYRKVKQRVGLAVGIE